MTRKVVATGNAELDSKMGGGLPVGSLVLIEGTSGAGKSVLTQQIVRGALVDGFQVSMFTSENTVKSMVSQMHSIDLDILDFLLLGKLRIYHMALTRLGEKAPTLLVNAMHRETERDVLVIDSFTSALAQASNNMNTLRFFEMSKQLCAKGKTVIVTLHTGTLSEDRISPVRSMCDAHIVLRSMQDGSRLIKTLEVAKVRGAATVTGSIVGFDVEPGWGMRVIPISKARG
jgi:archaeal flagellar protein FlaH